MILVVCSWRVLRETRNRQFFDPLGRNVNWVQYLAMVTNPPTSVSNFRLFWPSRKMNGNRSGFRVKPRQEHTTMRLSLPTSVGVLWAIVGNGEQW